MSYRDRAAVAQSARTLSVLWERKVSALMCRAVSYSPAGRGVMARPSQYPVRACAAAISKVTSTPVAA